MEETVISTAFDHDASNLTQVLRDKWRRLHLPQDARDVFESGPRGTTPETRAHLWQRIDGCVSMAARARSERGPIKG